MSVELEAIADLGLVLLVLGVAGWSLRVRDNLAAIIGFVAYGLLLALIWMRLAAPDVALTEAAVGTGLTGLLLLNAVVRLRSAGQTSLAPSPTLCLVATIGCTIVAGALLAIVLQLPDPAPTLAPAAAAHLASLGLGNPVTAVLLGYRAIDTLLEALILVPVLLGVWSLTSDADWGGVPQLQYRDPPGALVLLAQLLPPLGIIIGFYLCWNGADYPGGAFQGAAVLAAMWLLVLLAKLQAVPAVTSRSLRGLLVLGCAVFIAVGLLGIGVAGHFLAYPPAYAKPLILIIELVLTLSIAIVLALLVAGPAFKKVPS